MEKCDEMKVINSFSIKQEELDSAFAQHYSLHKNETAQKVCLQYVRAYNVERLSLKFFLFLKIWLGSPGSAFYIHVVM